MREITHAEWFAEGTRLFGEDKTKWKFVCPICAAVISVQDYKDAGAPQGAIGFSCIGRYIEGPAREAFGGKGNKSDVKSPCNYTNGGLFNLAPVRVNLPEGDPISAFDWAPVAA